MSTKFLSPGWRMPRNANQSKSSNYSIDFSGSGDKITLNSSVNLGTTSSISVWIKPSNYNVAVLGQTGFTYAYVIYLGSNGRLTFNLGWNGGSFGGKIINLFDGQTSNQSQPFTSFMTLNSWNHLVITRNGDTVTAYINGYKRDFGNFASSSLSDDTVFDHIGVQPPSNSYFNGEMDSLSAFNYVLSDGSVSVDTLATGDIATLYGSSSTGIGNPMSLSPKPVAYYPLGDQDAFNGANYLVPNSSLKDYVFEIGAYPRLINAGTIADLNSNMAELSVSIWFKKTGGNRTSDYAILSKVGAKNPTSFSLFWKRDQYATQGVNTAFKINNGSVQAVGGQTNTGNAVPITIEDNKWYNLVGTYNGNTQSLYINGVLHDFKSTTGNITGVSGNALLGADSTASYYNWLGELSNSMIWTKGLSQAEVTTLYNYGSPIQTLANIPQNSNLKAWYKLDASEVYNSSTTEWEINEATSPWTSSLSFGSNGTSHVALGLNSALPTSAITLSLWARSVDNSQNYKNIYIAKSSISGQDASIFVLINNANAAIKIMTDNGFAQNFNVPVGFNDNKWHHIAVTYDGTNIAYYSDGVSVSTASLSGTISYNTTTYPKAFIGTDPAISSSYFKGNVSNFQIFNTALTTANVTSLYNNGNPLTDMSSFTSLLNWYKLDNLTTGIEDSKGTQDGTNSGALEAVGSVSTLNGKSSGMTQANLVQSDLSFTSSYSPYALSFDGTNEKIAYTNGTIDLGLSSTETWWIKYSNTSSNSASIASAPVGAVFHILYEKTTNKIYYRIDTDVTLYYEWVIPLTYFTDNLWHHYAIVRDDSLPFSSYIKLYIDGNLFGSPTAVNATTKSTTNTKITDWGGASAYSGIVANLSNIAVWNTSLSSTEITEVFNSGVPSNLNNFSGTKPYSWWQLGSNMSYNSNWTILDEGTGNNNGDASNISEDSIVDGVGSYANGLSSGMSDNIVGDAPYSTANSLSVNMDVEDRVTDTPS